MAMRRAPIIPVPEPLVTVAEFIKMPESNEGYELIKGKLVKKPVPRWKHNLVGDNIRLAYHEFDRQKALGTMLPEIGVKLREDYSPVPDLGWWRAERVPDIEAEIAPIPDLAVEIHSPGQTVGDLTSKANDYIAGGVSLVWVIYPDKEMVNVFRPDRAFPEVVTIDGELNASEIIPGFKITMRELFKR